jgi:hypothetical protein
VSINSVTDNKKIEDTTYVGPAPIEKRPFSAKPLERKIKKIIKKILLPFEGMQLSIKGFESSLAVAKCWISAFPPVLATVLTIAQIPFLIYDALSLVTSSCDLHTMRKLYKVLKTAEQASPENKLHAMQKAVKELDETVAWALAIDLNFSRAGRVRLDRAVDTLRAHIAKGTVTQEDERLIRVLTHRIRIHIPCEIIDMVFKCAALAGGILALTPASPVAGAIIFAACAVEALAMWTFKELLLPRNPVKPTSKSRAMTGLTKVAKAARFVPDRIHAAIIRHKAKKQFATAAA